MRRQVFNAPNYIIRFRVWEHSFMSPSTNIEIPQVCHRRQLAKVIIACYQELRRQYPTPRWTVIYVEVASDDGLVDCPLQYELSEELSNFLTA